MWCFNSGCELSLNTDSFKARLRLSDKTELDCYIHKDTGRPLTTDLGGMHQKIRQDRLVYDNARMAHAHLLLDAYKEVHDRLRNVSGPSGPRPTLLSTTFLTCIDCEGLQAGLWPAALRGP